MLRSAAIDVGTNTVLLSVVEHDAHNPAIFTSILERGVITRLGQRVAETGHIHPARAKATLDCLRDYRALLDDLGVQRSRALGTSALRDARGAESFLEAARQILGVPLEVISGFREAELTYKGAHSGLPLPQTGSRFVFDIGGGSTELIWGEGPHRIEHAVSLQLGSVRLFEELKPADPPDHEDGERLARRVREAIRLADIEPARWARADVVIGVAGTVTSMAAIAHEQGRADLGALHGASLGLEQARDVLRELSMMTLAERAEIPCLGAGRADVIVCGAAIALAILERLDEARPSRSSPLSVLVSDRGVRYGALLELADLPHPRQSPPRL